MYTLTAYLDGQVGGSTAAGPEGRPAAPDGWSSNGLSNVVLTPIGDGFIVKVEAQFVIRTDIIASIPNPGRSYNYMLLAGFPPLDASIGAHIPKFGFSGNFDGLQQTPGASTANFTVDGTSVNNDAHGLHWYIVCSFFGSAPYNAWWTYDNIASEQTSFPNRCWFNSPNPATGKTLFRVVRSLWYFTSWAVVSPWTQSQELVGKVAQVDPHP
jgi:hypothetical protein